MYILYVFPITYNCEVGVLEEGENIRMIMGNFYWRMEAYTRSEGIILVLDGLSRLVGAHQKKKELENE